MKVLEQILDVSPGTRNDLQLLLPSISLLLTLIVGVDFGELGDIVTIQGVEAIFQGIQLVRKISQLLWIISHSSGTLGTSKHSGKAGVDKVNLRLDAKQRWV